MTVNNVKRGRTGTMQGRFIPKNPGKYVGNANRIIFRSSWELHVMKFFDGNPGIVNWSSEELFISYINPIKVDSNGRNKISKYFPDFVALIKDANGTVTKYIIEVKPHRETFLTAKSTDLDKMTFAVNSAKWKAAESFASRNNAKFMIMTEKNMFLKKPQKQKPNMNEPA